MMYDPLTGERIHPHACSYIPHLANPSPGKNSNPAKSSTESLRCASPKLSLKVHCRFQILLFTVIFKKICTCLNFYVDSLFKVSTILTLIKNCRGHIVGTESPFICLDSHGQFGMEALLCHSSCIYDQRCRHKVRTNAGRPGLKRQNPGILMAQVQVRAECSIVETHWTRPACEITSTVC